MKEVKLSNGVMIPAMGFGPMVLNYGKVIRTSRFNLPLRAYNKFVKAPYDRRKYVESISSAIKKGFRLIDFSASYGNMWAIGAAVKKSGIKRSELFLTGRISNKAQFGGRTKVKEQVYQILKEYETDYLDLLMFHWPVTGCFLDTWAEICELYKSGVTRSVGVANCEEGHLSQLLTSDTKPMVNQIEVHPLFSNRNVVEQCQQSNIVVESYTPLARMDDRLFRLPRLKAIAITHNKTVVQVVLRWHIQKGLVPCVRCLKDEHQIEALNIFDFSLDNEEMAYIDSININSRLRYDPKNCDFTIV